jgi:hypothetical protein
MGRYDPLREFLSATTEPSLRLTFAQIETILGDSLPASAREHQAWWANELAGTHSHARSWLDAGYRTQHLDLNAQTVEFARAGSSRT